MAEVTGDVRSTSAWPALPYSEWRDTCATLHLWTQIVGKIRVACTPWINHSWHVTLYVTARGLTTSLMPYGMSAFQIDFDFIDHQLVIARDDGRTARVGMYPRSVSDFYHETVKQMEGLDLSVTIHRVPNEIPDPIPFPDDHVHASYDAAYARRFWEALVRATIVFTDFRGEFIGKCSPVHFFWGSFDLAVTRFSGRRAPAHPGGIPQLPDWIGRESYSHEVSSAGFWPGNDAFPQAIFYSYAYPTPAGLADRKVLPGGARWSAELSEFVLPYEAIQSSKDPAGDLRAFLQSTYEAAADLANWDRAALEWTHQSRPEERRVR